MSARWVASLRDSRTGELVDSVEFFGPNDRELAARDAREVFRDRHPYFNGWDYDIHVTRLACPQAPAGAPHFGSHEFRDVGPYGHGKCRFCGRRRRT